jgi:hypothetical protein
MPSLLTRTHEVLVSWKAPLSQPRGINVYTVFIVYKKDSYTNRLQKYKKKLTYTRVYAIFRTFSCILYLLIANLCDSEATKSLVVLSLRS